MGWKNLKWKISTIFGIFGAIIVIEAVGLGQYIASALPASSTEKMWIWWMTGGVILTFLMIVNYAIYKRKEKIKRRVAS